MKRVAGTRTAVLAFGGVSLALATASASNCDITNSTPVCNTAKDCAAMLWRVPQQWHRKAKLRCEPVGDGGPVWLRHVNSTFPPISRHARLAG